MAGGPVAIRGFLVQTLIGLLEALDDKRAWNSVTLEPDVDSEKVDILWEYPDGTKKAVQVKSSQNPFVETKVETWAADLEAWQQADEYELVLVGIVTPAVAKLHSIGKVAVPAPKTLDIPALKEQAAQKLNHFLKQQRLPHGDPDHLESSTAPSRGTTQCMTYSRAHRGVAAHRSRIRSGKSSNPSAA